MTLHSSDSLPTSAADCSRSSRWQVEAARSITACVVVLHDGRSQLTTSSAGARHRLDDLRFAIDSPSSSSSSVSRRSEAQTTIAASSSVSVACDWRQDPAAGRMSSRTNALLVEPGAEHVLLLRRHPSRPENGYMHPNNHRFQRPIVIVNA